MLDSLTSKQISEWEAFDRIDPIGTWRDDFRMAFISALLTNIAIGFSGLKEHEKKKEMKSVGDFMPHWYGEEAKQEADKQSVEEMKSILLQLAREQNKRVAMQKRTTPPVKKTNKKKKDG